METHTPHILDKNINLTNSFSLSAEMTTRGEHLTGFIFLRKCLVRKSQFYNFQGLPQGAVIFGADDNLNYAYAGRIAFEGGIQVGKVFPRLGSLYIGYYGEEKAFTSNFEVLCQ